MNRIDQIYQLEDTFWKYITNSKSKVKDPELYKNLLLLLEENEKTLNSNDIERLFVKFPNDHYLSDVPTKNFVDFKIEKDYGDTVFGRCEGDDTYISMPKSEYQKIQEYKTKKS